MSRKPRKCSLIELAISTLAEYNYLASKWQRDSHTLRISVGYMLRCQRKQHKVSLRELAHRLKISPVYLSRMERGLRHCTIEWVRKIDAALSAPQEGSNEHQT